MSAMTNYLEQKLLDYIFNGSAFPSPSTYLALFTAAPGEAGGGTEVSGGSYAREIVNANGGAAPDWNLAVSEGGGGYLVDNNDDVTFTTATASWGTVTDAAVMDAVSAGNMLVYGTLTASKTVGNGDTFKFAAGDFDVIFK